MAGLTPVAGRRRAVEGDVAPGCGDPLTMPFAHESERHFAELLDFYGVRWEYEPVEFVLEWNEDRTPAAAFRPDFYLPTMGASSS